MMVLSNTVRGNQAEAMENPRLLPTNIAVIKDAFKMQFLITSLYK